MTPQEAEDMARYAQRIMTLEAVARDALQSLRRLPDVEGAYRVTCIAQLEKALAARVIL